MLIRTSSYIHLTKLGTQIRVLILHAVSHLRLVRRPGSRLDRGFGFKSAARTCRGELSAAPTPDRSRRRAPLCGMSRPLLMERGRPLTDQGRRSRGVGYHRKGLLNCTARDPGEALDRPPAGRAKRGADPYWSINREASRPKVSPEGFDHVWDCALVSAIASFRWRLTFSSSGRRRLVVWSSRSRPDSPNDLRACG